MMSKWKRVLKHAVTGYMPQGTGNGVPKPLLNQIKVEANPEVSEPLKQEKSQELSKMPEEEHDEQELEDDGEKPECFRNFDDTGGYDDTDEECTTCNWADDCQNGSPEREASDEGETGESKVEDAERPQRVKDVEPAKVESSEKPDKFTITKMMKTKAFREDGSSYLKTMPRGVGEVYTGEPPGKDDIEAILVPQFGGGEYSVINQSTKKVVKRYKFDGAAKDPDEPVQEPSPQSAPLAAAFQGVLAPPLQMQQQPGVPSQPQFNPTVDKIQAALAQGSVKAVDQLTAMAAKYADADDMDKFNAVMATLTQALTGQKQASSSDRLTDMLERDRTMMMTMLLEGKKGKETSSSDIVRETMGTMKEMFSMAKEFAPQGEDTGVAMVREVSGVVKDSLKEVTDTVIQVTGSKPLKQIEPAEEKIVYKCEKCGREVQPRWAVCPYCGVKFTGIITPPPLQAPVVIGQIPTETFRKSAPPLPLEIKDKMDYLRRLAVFIQESHDPVVKGSALLKAAGPEEKVMLLFTANFGYGNIMKLAQPWRHSTEIPEGEAIFRVIESANGRLWINKFFAAIRKSAEEEGLVLEQGTINHYLEEINKYSVIKFSFKPKPKPDAGPNLVPQPVMKKVRGQQVGMSKCPICEDMVPTLELKEHLFTMHPKKPAVVQQRVAEAIKHGAAVLPRMDQEQALNLPPLPEEPPQETPQEPLAPNGDGTEEE